METRDTSFSSFLATRKKTSSARKVIFSIVKVIDKVNRHNIIYSEISGELSDFKNDIIQRGRTIQQIRDGDSFRETNDSNQTEKNF